MKCPHAYSSKVVSQFTYTYDDEGRQSSCQQVVIDTREPIECIGNECACFLKDGIVKCHKGIS